MRIPLPEWVLGQLGENVWRELNEFCQETDLLDRKEVLRIVTKGRAIQAWPLLNRAPWWKTHIRREPSDIESWSI